METLLARYQQKIGTYDKQLWETRIEQREHRIYGLNHIQMRSAKDNTDLIDLDLVRGSSFTKAKPQHGFVKVARMATFRCFLMPFYAKWWIRQTSSIFFAFILFLYIVQTVNVAFFYMFTQSSAPNPLEVSFGSGSRAGGMSIGRFQGISWMEVVVPLLMAWLLSLIHSQIVATIPDKQKSRSAASKKLHFADEINSGSNGRRSSRVSKVPLDLQFKSYSLRRKYRSWFRKRTIDDDGFESLVGNGSRTSEDENSGSKPIRVVSSSPTSIKPEVFEASDVPEPGEPAAVQEPICIHCSRGSQEDQSLEEANSNCTSCLKCKNWVKHLDTSVVKSLSCTDSESENEDIFNFKKPSLPKRRSSTVPTIAITSAVDSNCDTENEACASPRDWTGVTTNSEDCSSDLDDVSDAAPVDRSNFFVADGDANVFLNPPSVKASCMIYERDDIKKADLSMLDISSIIIGKVAAMQSTPDYFYAGIVVSTLLALLPLLCRLTDDGGDAKNLWEACRNCSYRLMLSDSPLDAMQVVVEELPKRLQEFLVVAFGTSPWERYIVLIAMIQRFIFACMIFFLLVVAERTFKQRLLYAKLFSRLTSSRRARKSAIPHFRLNKVRNIKTWLSVRSYLKKRGPQRSVDVIVSTAFVVNLLLLAFLCAELLKETVSFSQYYLEALIWCVGLGVMLLRFITLGTKINKKYRNLSVLITEQINLHLQIEQKPHKKDELTVANNVLKLAIDLLKELENPFKISGLSANPILYNVTKLVILSALSGVLSEMLGFKLKLHKIKLK
ncbi:protein phtf isoform X3 [Dendroctonus ponderosae]|uniref:protein phtf isoform X3 n=1 Tax=Dendroctonus ponderosae TaxID=77166 RepID=UPI00203642C6|nr:protein phtf isoform X3 [Dendroctonus ponderosae]XP_048518404.1 protein phtf isoform X3 [Dendroctonus ponderosae]